MPTKMDSQSFKLFPTNRKKFDPEGSGYDMKTALEAGMTPDETPGENFGHFGSVVSTTSNERKKYNLPEESYLILKGRKHPTFHKAEESEKRRGFKVIKKGSRYYSVPDPEGKGTILNGYIK